MITEILIHTPLWVYGLFSLLIVVGLQQTRSRKVNRVAAYILPFGMIALSLAGINSSFGIAPVPIAMWALGLLVVSALGFTYFRDNRVTFIRSTRSFFIPGSWIPFGVIMAIFFTKYAFAVIKVFNADIVNTPVFIASLSLVYGCFSGYFSARAANLVCKAKEAHRFGS